MLGSQSERIALRHCDSDVDPGELSPRSSSVRIPAKPSSPTQKVYTPTAKARSLKAQFVEVYLGSAEFKASKLNAIIAINLQASDRLYEVVVINEASEEEIGRVYVYENELKLQMDARRKALSAIANANTEAAETAAAQFAARLVAAEGGSNPSLANRARRISATQKQRRTSQMRPSAFHKSMRSSSSFSASASFSENDTSISKMSFPMLVTARAAAQKFMDIKCNKNDQMKDEQLQKIMDYKNNPMKDSPLLNAPNPIDEPQSYFDLDMSTNIDPAVEGFTKYEKAAIDKNDSLISDDLSSAANDSIGFFTAVILSSFYARYKTVLANSGGKRPFQFVFFDGFTEDFFSFFYSLPPKCLINTVPTITDPKGLKARVDYTKGMKSDLDIENRVQVFVESARGHEGQAKNELRSIRIKRNSLTENLNPNCKRYRYMWHAAYNAVIAKLRRQKLVRSKWAGVMEVHKEQAAREAYLLEQSTSRKFRSLAVKTCGPGGVKYDDKFSIDDIAGYRDSLLLKKRKSNNVAQ